MLNTKLNTNKTQITKLNRKNLTFDINTSMKFITLSKMYKIYKSRNQTYCHNIQCKARSYN